MTTPDQLADFTFLAELSPAHRVAVAELAREVRFPAGTRLFEENQRASGCWLILSGRVALEHHVPGRGEVVVQTLEEGDVLGWSWLVPPRRWHLSASTTEPATALELDTERLLELAEQDPVFGYRLACGMFGVLLNRLQSTHARLLRLYRSPREP
jgi:CRP/FNR family transcriptional regulator, cyclic AMP receptor protein